VLKKLDKLDDMDKRFRKIENSMGNMKKEMGDLKEKVNEIENGMTHMNKVFEDNLKSISELSTSVQTVKKENSTINANIEQLNAEILSLKERQLDLQTRSMRNNLVVFNGIDEVLDQNTEEVLKKFLTQVMKVERLPEFHRVHRMGKRVRGKIRPIMAKFVNFKEKEKIQKSAVVLRDVENNKYSVIEQFPKGINDKRKQLHPHFKVANRQCKKAVLVYDKLYVNDELFILPNDEQSAGTA
jgi:chromosome segregation ATPase